MKYVYSNYQMSFLLSDSFQTFVRISAYADMTINIFLNMIKGDCIVFF